jgi:chromosome segregation ATPase
MVAVGDDVGWDLRVMVCATQFTYKRKRRSAKQIAAANHGLENSSKARGLPLQIKNTNMRVSSERTQAKELEKKVSTLTEKVEEERRKRYTTAQHAQRLHKANEACKINLKQEKRETHSMRGKLEALEQEIRRQTQDTANIIQHLTKRVETLEQTRKDQNQKHTTLKKRCKYLTNSNQKLKSHPQNGMKNHSSVFQMKAKRRYSDQARRLARLLVASGTAETKVGKTLVEIGNELGIEVKGEMSTRTVQRTILEKGVAADMQIAYEVLNSGSKCSF